MTNEEKQIAIAEACGWHISHDGPEGYWQGLHPRFHQADDTPVKLPDYLNSLDAMHEAEKSLNLPQCERYWDELLTMCGPSRMIHASASVRADAFLKTIGKLP